MVLNSVTKFHKILIKSIRLRGQTLFDRHAYILRYVCTEGLTGVTLNAPAIVMVGHNKKKLNENLQNSAF